jgi:hypothetical protein
MVIGDKLPMQNLLDEIRNEYELYVKNPVEYEKNVNSISDLFGLKGKNRFKSDNCFVYVVGKYQRAPVIMFGINPGYSSTNNPTEENEARKSWQHYQSLYVNFYEFFSNNKFESPYYTALWYLLSGLTGIKNSQRKEMGIVRQVSLQLGTNSLPL